MPISVTLLGILISFKAVHSSKDSEPISLTVFGIVISSNDAQPSKAEPPTVVIPAPIFTFLRLVQSENAPKGIVTRFSPFITTVSSFLQPLNTLLPISAKESGKVTLIRFLQYSKAPDPIVLTDFPIVNVLAALQL